MPARNEKKPGCCELREESNSTWLRAASIAGSSGRAADPSSGERPGRDRVKHHGPSAKFPLLKTSWPAPLHGQLTRPSTISSSTYSARRARDRASRPAFRSSIIRLIFSIISITTIRTAIQRPVSVVLILLITDLVDPSLSALIRLRAPLRPSITSTQA